MAVKALPSPEVLRQLLRYEPDTGKLFWKERPRSMFPSRWSYLVWNKRYAGQEALAFVGAGGYKTGRIFKCGVSAHRAAWAIQYGEWPLGLLDHANRDKLDNRLENLRLCTARENSANKSKRKNASSKYLGVSFNKRVGKWSASMSIGSKKKHLGFYTEEPMAAIAYDQAAMKIHGSFANLNFPEAVNV